MGSVEVNKSIVGSFVTSIGDVSEVFMNKAREDLEDNGIQIEGDDEWHDAEAFAEVLRHWTDERSERAVRLVGEQMSNDLSEQFPDDADVVTALNLMSEVHEQVHRGDGYVGGYTVDSQTDDAAIVVAEYGKNRFPEQIARGAIIGVVENASDETASIELTDSDVDDERATYEYHVEW